MKKYLFFYCILILASIRCEILDPIEDNRTQENLIPDEVSIVDQKTAQNALSGLYNSLHRFEGLQFSLESLYHVIGALLGVEASVVQNLEGGFSEAALAFNAVLPDNTLTTRLYQESYNVINIANNIIDKVAPLENIDPAAKDAITSEARFIRALVYSYLIQYFTPFYDASSVYGLVLKSKRTTWDIVHEQIPRSTLEETYAFVLEDLAFAIENTGFTTATYANTLAARALKARILLYRGLPEDLPQVIQLAQQVIQHPQTSLATTYVQLFNYDIYRDTPEAIFALDFNGGLPGENNENGFTWGFVSNLILHPNYVALSSGDTRQPRIVAPNFFVPGTYLNAKYYNAYDASNVVGGSSTSYFIRLAEMYLIAAEALARNGASAAEVKQYLHPVQTRAAAPLTQTEDISELLEAIRLEKIKELGTENGIAWTDMIRYAVRDGLNLSLIKPSLLRPEQYILPIPEISVERGVVQQNPGY